MLIRENVLKENYTKNYKDFEFKELPNMPKINLRGDCNDKNFINNVEKILEISIPREANTNNGNNKLKIIWLSPNEWLIEIYEKIRFDNILLELKKNLDSQNTAITDITESRTILELKGNNLYKLLSKFMIINLDEVLKKESSVAQTIFVKVPVLIVRNYKKDEDQNINLYTNRSHAEYIINLLIDGAENIDF